MPAVSVIIPNYNHARFLRARVDSVLSQTFRDFDVLLMDDASKDDSREVINEYADDDRITVLLNSQNSGSPFKQWNAGVQRATGTYIWIAESDDVADARFLERLIEVLEQNRSVGLAYCQSIRIDQDGNELGTLLDYVDDLAPGRWNNDYVASGEDEIRTCLAKRCTIPNASAVVFRREVYSAVGGADPALTLTGDHLVWIKMAAEADVAFIKEPLNYFRQHAGTVRSSSEKQVSSFRECLYIRRYLAKQLGLGSSHSRMLSREVARLWLGASRRIGLSGGFHLDAIRTGLSISPLFPLDVGASAAKSLVRMVTLQDRARRAT